MRSRRAPEDDATHVPVEMRLSGDFGSPLELMTSKDLSPEQKRHVLEVWLQDLEAQPESAEKRELHAAIWQALTSLDSSAVHRRD